jgi:hypothetical protein
MMTEPQQVFEGVLRLVRDRDLNSYVDLSVEDGTPEPRGLSPGRLVICQRSFQDRGIRRVRDGSGRALAGRGVGV